MTGVQTCALPISFVAGELPDINLPGNFSALGAGTITAEQKNTIMTLISNEFQSGSLAIDPNAVKIDPVFHVTGGVVAIDPNNPVPTSEKPDNGDAGNINIDIKKGKFFIVSSKRYLKLLESARAEGGGFKAVLWGEI